MLRGVRGDWTIDRECAIRQAMKTGAIPLREMRVMRADEERRWNELVRTHHYQGFRSLCGRRLNRFDDYWDDRAVA